MAKVGNVSLTVVQDGRVELNYAAMTIQEALELIQFLRDFMPDAQFTIQPVQH